MMKKKLLIPLLLLSGAAFANTWNGVPLVDKQCSRKAAANPDAHTKQCAMGCAGSGFGILTSDGKFLKFDKAGDEQALAALKQTDKTDHLRVTVDGEEKDGVIAVKSVKLD
jgi:hypothetical protein